MARVVLSPDITPVEVLSQPEISLPIEVLLPSEILPAAEVLSVPKLLLPSSTKIEGPVKSTVLVELSVQESTALPIEAFGPHCAVLLRKAPLRISAEAIRIREAVVLDTAAERLTAPVKCLRRTWTLEVALTHARRAEALARLAGLPHLWKTHSGTGSGHPLTWSRAELSAALERLLLLARCRNFQGQQHASRGEEKAAAPICEPVVLHGSSP